MFRKGIAHCFDATTPRTIPPEPRTSEPLQAWIAQNIYLSLKSVPFSMDDATLVAGSGNCANCPKRTGFNALLFSEVREDSCVDAECFNRKLDAHIGAACHEDAESRDDYAELQRDVDTPVLARRNYVEVVTRNRRREDARPEQRLCDHLKPAIYADGMEKGRLIKSAPTQTARFIRQPTKGRRAAHSIQSGKTAANGRRSRLFLSGTALWPTFSNV